MLYVLANLAVLPALIFAFPQNSTDPIDHSFASQTADQSHHQAEIQDADHSPGPNSYTPKTKEQKISQQAK
jgi:hypothetical protein